MEAAVKLAKATVKAGSRKILDSADFTAGYGDFIAVLGPNGAGKTTLLKTILGFLKISSGSAGALGREITGGNVSEIRRQAGYVPQSISVDRFFPILAGGVLRLGAGPDAALEAAEELKITGLLDRPFGLLSGGEKQKVLLAMALARKPKLLLLDEPNLNLDMRAYRDFLSLVDKIHLKHKLTVIFVTHLISQIPQSCRRVVAMKNGRVAFEAPAKSLLKKKNAEELIYG
jgi:ABC-type Mn2+/Zn2+ transport system ATPase subunit